MALEIAKDKISLNQMIEQKIEVVTIDGDVIVNDVKPDVLKVLETNGIVCIYKQEVLNGKVKVEGSINTYVIYLADDEEKSIRTINTNLDFAEIIDIKNCKEGMTLESNYDLKGFETKIVNGRKLHIKAIMDVDLKVFKNEELEVVVGIENSENDIEVKKHEKSILSLMGENTGKTTLKDTIKINENDEIAEIMKVSLSFSNTQTKISYNKVIIKSDVNLNVMYQTVDNRINEVFSKIPLMGFIDMPNITENSKCISKLSLKNLILRLDDQNNYTVYIEADVNLYCKVFEEKDLNIIEDAYSVSKNIELKKASINITGDEVVFNDIIEIRERLVDPPELMYGRVLSINVIPKIESTKVNTGSIKYSGNLDLEFIIDSDNSINVFNKKVPFEYEFLSDEITRKSNVETSINVLMQKIEILDEAPVLSAQLEINAILKNYEKLELIEDLSAKENNNEDKNIYSMIIYFVKPGDTLWNIAKAFKSKVPDIARVNGIEENGLIYPGQQLYIPKFINKKITI